MFDIIVGVLPFVIPYTVFGENLSAALLASFAIIYILLNKSKVRVDKKFIIILIALIVVAIISQVLISPYIESLSGILNYINILLYYLVFSITINKAKILDYIVYSIGILVILFILVQGLYYDVRIYGNIGYANSYALLLLVSIYFNRIRENENFADYLEMLFGMGIFFTGSRTTIILLCIYIVVKFLLDIKNKSKSSTIVIINFVYAAIQYGIYYNLRLASILVIPIILISYSWIRKIKIHKSHLFIFISATIVILTVINSNTIDRIKNLSIYNGSLQERFIYYEDATKSILQNPLGNGINMFQYKQYEGASAFYDVKYIHNAILQVSYDIGILGGIIFILIFIYGAYIILKSKYKEKYLILSLYISIFIHSMLDFDFSYSTFWIIIGIIMILVFDYKKVELKIRFKILLIPILILIIYLSIIEGSIVLGKGLSLYGKYNNANKIFSSTSKLSLSKDSRAVFNEANNYWKLYDEEYNEEYMDKALELLKEASIINPYDPRIIWNMAYINEKLGNIEDTLRLRGELYDKQKYYPSLYEVQREYLNRLYNETKDPTYIKYIDEVEENYNKVLEALNPRAKYIKNQIK